mmetsp:Transcript_56913/g.101564  ORF Transcript_56913/g.101564 Transcript_56913/m.101564 type:complete len:207 (+) Transcript_56913:710-1330(+)
MEHFFWTPHPKILFSLPCSNAICAKIHTSMNSVVSKVPSPLLNSIIPAPISISIHGHSASSLQLKFQGRALLIIIVLLSVPYSFPGETLALHDDPGGGYGDGQYATPSGLVSPMCTVLVSVSEVVHQQEPRCCSWTPVECRAGLMPIPAFSHQCSADMTLRMVSILAPDISSAPHPPHPFHPPPKGGLGGGRRYPCARISIAPSRT